MIVKMSIMKICTYTDCTSSDFLPLKCDACQMIFCKEHMVYSCHNCPSACQKDVQVPLCPLCNAPVLVGPGEQPDKVVGEHIEQDCQAISAIDRRKIIGDGCGKNLFTDISSILYSADSCLPQVFHPKITSNETILLKTSNLPYQDKGQNNVCIPGEKNETSVDLDRIKKKPSYIKGDTSKPTDVVPTLRIKRGKILLNKIKKRRKRKKTLKNKRRLNTHQCSNPSLSVSASSSSQLGLSTPQNDSASCVLQDNLKQAQLSSPVEVSTAPNLQEHTKFHSDSRLIVQDILETAIKSMLDNVTEASSCDTNAVPVQQNSKMCSTNVCSPQNIEENVKSQQPVPEVVSEVGSEAVLNCSLGSLELPDNVKSKKDSGKTNNITKENETDSSFLGKMKIEGKDIYNLMCHVNLANEDNMLLSVEENTGSVLRPVKEIKFDIDKVETKQVGNLVSNETPNTNIDFSHPENEEICVEKHIKSGNYSDNTHLSKIETNVEDKNTLLIPDLTSQVETTTFLVGASSRSVSLIPDKADVESDFIMCKEASNLDLNIKPISITSVSDTIESNSSKITNETSVETKLCQYNIPYNNFVERTKSCNHNLSRAQNLDSQRNTHISGSKKIGSVINISVNKFSSDMVNDALFDDISLDSMIGVSNSLDSAKNSSVNNKVDSIQGAAVANKVCESRVTNIATMNVKRTDIVNGPLVIKVCADSSSVMINVSSTDADLSCEVASSNLAQGSSVVLDSCQELTTSRILMGSNIADSSCTTTPFIVHKNPKNTIKEVEESSHGQIKQGSKSINCIEGEPKYKLEVESSLPLKKRLKCLTHVVETNVKTDSLKSSISESLPSYPATPMISIAELELSKTLFTNNVEAVNNSPTYSLYDNPINYYDCYQLPERTDFSRDMCALKSVHEALALPTIEGHKVNLNKNFKDDQHLRNIKSYVKQEVTVNNERNVYLAQDMATLHLPVEDDKDLLGSSYIKQEIDSNTKQNMYLHEKIDPFVWSTFSEKNIDLNSEENMFLAKKARESLPRQIDSNYMQYACHYPNYMSELYDYDYEYKTRRKLDNSTAELIHCKCPETLRSSIYNDTGNCHSNFVDVKSFSQRSESIRKTFKTAAELKQIPAMEESCLNSTVSVKLEQTYDPSQSPTGKYCQTSQQDKGNSPKLPSYHRHPIYPQEYHNTLHHKSATFEKQNYCKCTKCILKCRLLKTCDNESASVQQKQDSKTNCLDLKMFQERRLFKTPAELKQIPVSEKESSISFLLKTEPSSTPIDSNQPSKLSDPGKHESVEADAKQVLDLRVLKDSEQEKICCQRNKKVHSRRFKRHSREYLTQTSERVDDYMKKIHEKRRRKHIVR